MRAHPAGPRHADLDAPRAVTAAPAPDDGTLDHRLWPRTARRDIESALASGAMVVGGCDVRDLARDYGTALFVLDEQDWHARAIAFNSVPDVDAYYAAKAFLATTVARWADDDGLGIDVCTGGELAVVAAAGFPPGRVILHGNNKSDDELRAAMDYGLHRYVIDALDEIPRVARLAAERGHVADVLLRVTVGVEAHTHEFIATAHEDQKFGLSLATGEALEAVRRVIGLPALRLRGLHTHIGSQIFDAAGFEVAAHRMVGLVAMLAEQLAVTVEELNVGGGFGVAYTAADDPLDAEALIREVASTIARECAAAGLACPRLSIEPGRAVVGPSMITLYEVGTVKPVTLDGGMSRTYVSVDGGMSDNIRTALYGAEYTVTLASRLSSAPPCLARVVGKHCESGDIVVRDAWLPADVATGDLLAVAATGAYCRSMSSSYNYVGRAPVVSVRDGISEVVLRRETVEDLLRLDPGVLPVR